MRSCMYVEYNTLAPKAAASFGSKGRQGEEGTVRTNPAWRIKGRTSDGPARQEARLVFDMEARKETGSGVLSRSTAGRDKRMSRRSTVQMRLLVKKKGEERRCAEQLGTAQRAGK